MTVGARRVFACAAVVCAACLVTVAGLRAQTAPERVPMVEETFKTVQLLKGIPVDTFFEVMGTFASSMGNDCTFCHASNAALDKSAFATQTPRIQRARQMITMVKAINQQYFGGAPRVTCFTCHGGSNVPKADPSFMSQYGEPVLDPDARDFLTDASVNVNQVFAKYIQALGGADKLAKLTSYAAKGTYSGFDTDRSTVPIELYAKAPAQQTVVVHLTIGASTRVFDGQNAWVAGTSGRFGGGGRWRSTVTATVTTVSGTMSRSFGRARRSIALVGRWNSRSRMRGGRSSRPVRRR